MDISCCVWALSTPEENALQHLADLGFAHIDVQALTYTTPSIQAQIDALGMRMRCVGLSFNMEEGAALDSADATARRRAVEHVERGLDQAASSHIDTAYVVPGDEDDLLGYFSESLIAIADMAAARQIALGVEHFPGKALPTAAGTLAYLEDLAHDNLYLLLDSGHLQISGEDPAAVIAQAGSRLGYAHLDDNDGRSDLHWALCDGVLTRTALRDLLVALNGSAYAGPVSLELHPTLPDPVAALRESVAIVRDILGETQ